MTAAEVWESPTEHSASSITQERVMKLNDALDNINRHFLAFQHAREVDEPSLAVAAITKLAADLSTAAPLARLLERDAIKRSAVQNKE